MATTTKKKTSTKKAPAKAPKQAKAADATAKQRKAAIAEIDQRLAGGDAPLHEGTVVRGDGKVVKVTVPRDDHGPATEAATPEAPPHDAARSPKGRKGAKDGPGAKVENAAAGDKAAGKSRKAPKEKRLSGLDLAAQVVAKAKEPMSAKAIAEAAIALGWKTSGKTPHATLYAAMIREISAKGKESRFKKADRGLFTASSRKGA